MHLVLCWLNFITLSYLYVTIILLKLQKTRLHRTLVATEQLDLSSVDLHCSFERAWSYFATYGCIYIDLIPCVVYYFLHIYFFNVRGINIYTSTYAVNVSIIETTTGCSIYCNGIVCDIPPDVVCYILPLALFDDS